MGQRLDFCFIILDIGFNDIFCQLGEVRRGLSVDLYGWLARGPLHEMKTTYLRVGKQDTRLTLATPSA